MLNRILAAAVLGIGASISPPAIAEQAGANAAVDLRPEFSQRVVKSGETGRIYLKVGIKVARLEPALRRAPLNVALVIDRSGSMHGARIEGARKAAMMAVERLQSRDIVSVVSYDDKVEVEVPATRASDHERVNERIRRLTPRGSTAIHAGMMAGLGEVSKFQSRDTVNRIILLSDGLANVGPSSPEHFARLGREIAGKGITVSTIGLGLGYNEDLMSKLAINGDGSHVLVQEPADLANFLNREIDEISNIYAQDVSVTIELDQRLRPLRSLGREATITPERITWKLGQLVAGAEQVLLAEIEVPSGLDEGTREIGRVVLGYRTSATGESTTLKQPIAITASRSDSEVEASATASVMRDVTILTARERKDAAIRLRDAGRHEEARQAFQQNAIDMAERAKRYKFDGDANVQRELEANAAAASPSASSSEAWNKQRKVLREQDANYSGATLRF